MDSVANTPVQPAPVRRSRGLPLWQRAGLPWRKPSAGATDAIVNVFPSRGGIRGDLEDGGARIDEAITSALRLSPELRPLTVRDVALATLVSTLAVGGALVLALLCRNVLHPSIVLLLFLPPVLLSGVRYGFVGSVWAALLSVIVTLMFLSDAPATVAFSESSTLLALLAFLLVAFLTSSQAARIRNQSAAIWHQSNITEELFSFGSKLAAISSTASILDATVDQVHSMLGLDTAILLPDGDELEVRASSPPHLYLNSQELRAARWCWERGEPAGRGAGTLHGVTRLYLPLQSGPGTVGVLSVRRNDDDALLSPDVSRLLHALATQAAMSLERAQLADQMQEAHLLAEADRLRAALLTSISHDLKTPLASILGNISSLRQFSSLYDDATRAEMLATAQAETERLSRFVGNLLDMTRIDAGALRPRMEMADLSDVVGSSLKSAQKLLARHRLEIDLAPDLPMVPLDFVLMEHVLVNLLDNAAKYAPACSLIRLTAHEANQQLHIAVIDEGPGIPAEELTLIFERFFRADATDQRSAGTGLGLAICKGFIEAMGGSIAACNRDDGPSRQTGAVFNITLATRRRENLASANRPLMHGK